MHSSTSSIGPPLAVSSSIFEALNCILKKGPVMTSHVSALHERYEKAATSRQKVLQGMSSSSLRRGTATNRVGLEQSACRIGAVRCREVSRSWAGRDERDGKYRKRFALMHFHSAQRRVLGNVPPEKSGEQAEVVAFLRELGDDVSTIWFLSLTLVSGISNACQV